jgi:hypothetical protein
MLLQTNSYIVPRDKRAEHARLLRRFRQTLLRLGCDHFEVYEQVGPNWSSADSSGRFVQIMRFRDRKHQTAVQGAERSDPAAQSLLKEFCDLINLPYQQQQGLFAVGYYTSFLRMPQRLEGPDSFAAPAETSEEAAEESSETAESPAVEELPAEAEGLEAIGVAEAPDETSDETSTEEPAAEEPAADGEVENIENKSESHSDSEAATADGDSEDSLDPDGIFAPDNNGDPTESPELAHPVSDPEDETESLSSGTEAQSDESQSDEVQPDDDESEVSPNEKPSTPFSS